MGWSEPDDRGVIHLTFGRFGETWIYSIDRPVAVGDGVFEVWCSLEVGDRRYGYRVSSVSQGKSLVEADILLMSGLWPNRALSIFIRHSEVGRY